MVISRTKQLVRKVRSSPDKKAHEAKMKDAIAARHSTRRIPNSICLGTQSGERWRLLGFSGVSFRQNPRWCAGRHVAWPRHIRLKNEPVSSPCERFVPSESDSGYSASKLNRVASSSLSELGLVKGPLCAMLISSSRCFQNADNPVKTLWH
jgi:hypothetical protein